MFVLNLLVVERVTMKKYTVGIIREYFGEKEVFELSGTFRQVVDELSEFCDVMSRKEYVEEIDGGFLYWDDDIDEGGAGKKYVEEIDGFVRVEEREESVHEIEAYASEALGSFHALSIVVDIE